MKTFKTSSSQYKKSDFVGKKETLPRKFLPKKAKTPVCNFLLKRESIAKFYTGLGEKLRRVFWEYLSDCKEQLEILDHPEKKKSGELLELSVECQFLLTLHLLRRNITYHEASLHYNIGNSWLVSQVFKSWLQFFFYELKEHEAEWFTKFKDLPRPPKAFQNPIMESCRVVIGKKYALKEYDHSLYYYLD